MQLSNASLCVSQRYTQIWVVLIGHTKRRICHVGGTGNHELATFHIHNHVRTQKDPLLLQKEIILQLNPVGYIQLSDQGLGFKMHAMPTQYQISFVHTFMFWCRDFPVCMLSNFFMARLGQAYMKFINIGYVSLQACS
jgi:hypothetical protein